MDIGGYIFMILFIAVAVGGMIVMPIITVVNAHREKDGKEPVLFRGRTRRIVIVNKRVSERVYYDGGPIPAMSVDYRIVGGKILYTKDIDEELFDRIAVGQTYKALIRDGAVKKIDLC